MADAQAILPADSVFGPPDPDWDTGNLLPLATKRDPTTGKLQISAAVPGFARDLVNALAIPGDVWKGNIDPSAVPGAAREFAGQASGLGLGVGSLVRDAGGAAAVGMTRGWHGTPHTFEPVEGNPFGEFRDEAIGSGEGAQSYGYGHYVAGNPKVAQDYANRLGVKDITYEGRPIVSPKSSVDDQNWFISQPQHVQNGILTLTDNGGDVKSAIASLKNAGIDDAAKWLQDNENKLGTVGGGSLLHVKIRPDESELLDWDKPTGQQPTAIQTKLKNLFPGQDTSEWNGETAYKELSAIKNKKLFPTNTMSDSQYQAADQAASAALHEAGIPGIKYLDAGSRGLRQPEEVQADIDSMTALRDKAKAGEPGLGGTSPEQLTQLRNDRLDKLQDELKQAKNPTRNYVIFHPSNLKITGRNGEHLEPVEHDPWSQQP